MSPLIQLSSKEWNRQRPFTHPRHIAEDEKTLRYMAGQVCVLLDYPYLSSEPPHTVLFNRPDHSHWFHRIVLADPDPLRRLRPLTVVGFFGQKQAAADQKLAHEFDRTLIAEIPQYPGLLSYSSMALNDGNYANLVIFTDRAARDRWSTSQAHAKAVHELSPNYYHTVTIVNGRLPEGIYHHHDLILVRAKYYDYQCRPRWQAVREILTTD